MSNDFILPPASGDGNGGQLTDADLEVGLVPPVPCLGLHRCATPFARVYVDHIVRSGSRVHWTLRPNFLDPLPHIFQLQVGRTGVNVADDWESVGLPITNSFYALDTQQRVFGRTQWTHYRVILTTPLGTYLSEPVFGLGDLSRQDWLRARAVFRRAYYYARDAWTEGYLLKRRWVGEPCPCRDLQTEEVTNPEHELCYGTGVLGGYFAPMGCIWSRMDADQNYEQVDIEVEGSVSPSESPFYMLAAPELMTEDIWVRKGDDQRFFVHPVKRVVSIRQTPILQSVTMRPIEFSNVVYKIPIPERDVELGLE